MLNKRLMLTATGSDSGKTTVTLAVLAGLKARGFELVSFKAGPDYIDPTFHREALEIEAYNLDPFFMDPNALSQILDLGRGKLSIIEGVMGYYDGIGLEGRASSHELALATASPAVLIIDAQKMYQSVAALAEGFKNHKPGSMIKGVIFNRIKGHLYPELKAMIENIGLEAYGYLPIVEGAQVEEIYLGLKDLPRHQIQATLKSLEEVALQTLDLDGLIKLAESAPNLQYKKTELYKLGDFHLAVAKDQAFRFLYPENIMLLQALGARVSYFSPLESEKLPSDIDLLYLPGGYPEQFAKQLNAQGQIRSEIKSLLDQGLPCIAEGGGFLYLHKKLQGEEMVAFLPGEAELTDSIQGFGYHYVIPKESDYLLGSDQSRMPAHRFHYCRSSMPASAYLTERVSSGKTSESGYGSSNLYAGFSKFYFPAILNEIQKVAQKAIAYRQSITFNTK